MDSKDRARAQNLLNYEKPIIGWGAWIVAIVGMYFSFRSFRELPKKVWKKAILSVSGMVIITLVIGATLWSMYVSMQKPVDWQEEIAQYIDGDYIEYIARTLVGIGAYKSPENPDERWHRIAGTAADHETAQFLADEMENVGLVDVALEPVPVHTWDFKGASLEIVEPVERTIVASCFSGSWGTDEDGITGELVYVGSYIRDYEGVDVEGKIALANWDGSNIWISDVISMATKHGAIGVVASLMPGQYYAQTPGALSMMYGSLDPDWAPNIYIPGDAGQELRELLETGETVTVTMKSDITLDFDGTGYNVIGYLPGKNYGDPDDNLLIISAHHDSWFTGGADDTGAVANLMAHAKAMADAYEHSGYRPEKTMVFTSRTAEEFGYTNTWMGWSIGAWYQITQEHPDWAGRVIAGINHEIQAQKGAPMRIIIPRELFSLTDQVIADNRDLLPYGSELVPEISTWNDGFTFTAAGVPTMTTYARWSNYSRYLYHTQYDSINKLDFEYSTQLVEVYIAIILRLDTATIIPYNFVSRAENLVESLDARDFASANVDSSVYRPVIDAAEEFLSLAKDLKRAVERVKENEVEMVNDVLLDVVVKELSALSAMDVWEDVIYPHEQPLRDSIYLVEAIGELEDAMQHEDDDLAMGAVMDLKDWVGMTWYYDYLDYETYIENVESYRPDYWGAQAHLFPASDAYLEVDSMLNKIEARNTDYTDEIASLTDTLHVARDESLKTALQEIEAMLTYVNAQLGSII